MRCGIGGLLVLATPLVASAAAIDPATAVFDAERRCLLATPAEESSTDCLAAIEAAQLEVDRIWGPSLLPRRVRRLQRHCGSGGCDLPVAVGLTSGARLLDWTKRLCPRSASGDGDAAMSADCDRALYLLGQALEQTAVPSPPSAHAVPAPDFRSLRWTNASLRDAREVLAACAAPPTDDRVARQTMMCKATLDSLPCDDGLVCGSGIPLASPDARWNSERRIAREMLVEAMDRRFDERHLRQIEQRHAERTLQFQLERHLDLIRLEVGKLEVAARGVREAASLREQEIRLRTAEQQIAQSAVDTRMELVKAVRGLSSVHMQPPPPESSASAVIPQIDPLTPVQNYYALDRGSTVRYGIILVPDPRVPRHRRSYELSLRALRSGFGAGGYQLDRYFFPWQDYSHAQSDQWVVGESGERDYGVLVYRRDGQRRPESRGTDLVVLLVVAETASFGIHQHAFRQAYFRARDEVQGGTIGDTAGNGSEAGQPEAAPLWRNQFLSGPRELSIIGPNFSGSLSSIHTAVREIEQEPGRRVWIDLASRQEFAAQIDQTRRLLADARQMFATRRSRNGEIAYLEAMVEVAERCEAGKGCETPEHVDLAQCRPANSDMPGCSRLLMQIGEATKDLALLMQAVEPHATGRRADLLEQRVRLISSSITASSNSDFFRPQRTGPDTGGAKSAGLRVVVALEQRAVPDSEKIRAIFRELGIGDQSTVLLVSEDSDYGNGVLSDLKTKKNELHRLIHTRFPPNLSQVRLHHRNATAGLQPSHFLASMLRDASLPIDEGQENGSEFPESHASGLTSASLEQQLRLLLAQVAAIQPDVAIIAATDVRDRLYLIDRLGAVSPRTQLVDLEADLLLAHPDYLHATRGTVLVSSAAMSTGAEQMQWAELAAYASDDQALLRQYARDVASNLDDAGGHESSRRPGPEALSASGFECAAADDAASGRSAGTWQRHPHLYVVGRNSIVPLPPGDGTSGLRTSGGDCAAEVPATANSGFSPAFAIGWALGPLLLWVFLLGFRRRGSATRMRMPVFSSEGDRGALVALWVVVLPLIAWPDFRGFIATSGWMLFRGLAGSSNLAGGGWAVVLALLQGALLVGGLLAVCHLGSVARRLHRAVADVDYALARCIGTLQPWSSLCLQAAPRLAATPLLGGWWRMRNDTLTAGLAPEVLVKQLCDYRLSEDSAELRFALRGYLQRDLFGAVAAAGTAALCLVGVIAMNWHFPVVGRQVAILLAVIGLVLLTLMAIRLLARTDRHPLLSRLFCDRHGERPSLLMSVSSLTLLLLPLLLSLVAVDQPGVLGWSDGLRGLLGGFLKS